MLLAGGQKACSKKQNRPFCLKDMVAFLKDLRKNDGLQSQQLGPLGYFLAES
jgi:hypothetical protein